MTCCPQTTNQYILCSVVSCLPGKSERKTFRRNNPERDGTSGSAEWHMASGRRSATEHNSLRGSWPINRNPTAERQERQNATQDRLQSANEGNRMSAESRPQWKPGDPRIASTDKTLRTKLKQGRRQNTKNARNARTPCWNASPSAERQSTRMERWSTKMITRHSGTATQNGKNAP